MVVRFPAPPEAFGFVGASPSSISVSGSYLEVPERASLSLVGGDISVTGGVGGGLRAPSGTINLVSVAGPGQVSWGTGPVDVSSVEDLGAIDMADQAQIDARGSSGGKVVVRAGRFTMIDSEINAGTTGDVDNTGPGVDIEVTGEMRLSSSEIASSATAQGDAGDIHIVADYLELDTDTPSPIATNIGSRVFDADGDGANISIEANTFVVRDGAFVNTAPIGSGSGSGGDIVITVAGDLDVINGSSISANTFSLAPAGDLTVEAHTILLDGQGAPASVTALGSFANGGDAGTVTILADQLLVLNGSEITASTFAQGQGGNLIVEARDVVVSGFRFDPSIGFVVSGMFATSVGFATGDGGTISVSADSMDISDFARVGTFTFSDSTGNAGNIELDVHDLHVGNGAWLTSTAFGSGDGGRIVVRADQFVIENRGQVFATSSGFGGIGGDIDVTAGTVLIRDGGILLTSALGLGDGGDLHVSANEITVSGTGEFFSALDSGVSAIASQAGLFGGNGGAVKLNANSIVILNGGRVTTETFGPGNAGIIEIETGLLLVSGRNDALNRLLATPEDPEPLASRSAILAGSSGFFLGDAATGDAGRISITTSNVELSDYGLIASQTETPGLGGEILIVTGQMFVSGEARVTAQSSGTGNAGNIRIVVADRLEVENASLTTEAVNADGGNVVLLVGSLLLLRQGEVSTAVGTGQGNGGNIFIDPVFVVLDSSRIVANAFGGSGGNILIVADHFIATPDSVVEASSALGIDGVVQIDSPDTDVSSGLVVVPAAFLDASSLLAESCSASRAGQLSSFIGTGRGGVALDPVGPILALYALDRELAASATEGSADSIEPMEQQAAHPAGRHAVPVAMVVRCGGIS